MDMRSWKKVLLQWITECGFMERSYFNIEQSDIEEFYQNFNLKHLKTANGNYKRLSDFLKEFYPNFEAHQDDDNCVSSSDYAYIYSILLHFCCVKHPQKEFHEICQRLPEHAQQCIASFFKELLDNECPTKEDLRSAIGHVVTTHNSPPRQDGDSFSSNQSINSAISVGIGSGGIGVSVASGIANYSLHSPGYIRCDSPLKTPKRCAGPQRISPTTPKSYLLEERTRELYNLKAQLETERYEKGLLEVQIKQNEDEILKLSQEHKKLHHQIQDLKNEIILKTSDGDCTENHECDEQMQKRLLKEISTKEHEIIKLNDIVRTLREEKALIQEKLSYAEKQILICMNRISELDFKVDELKEEIEKKNNTIQYLSNSKVELEQFISDNRIRKLDNSELNTSMECFDTSFARNIGNTNASSNLSSPENLGASVVDVQLREKEHENSKLKEELELVKDEHKRLAKNLHDLTERQAKEFDIILEHSINESEIAQEDTSQQSDPLEQLSLFSSCMEKISSFHKMEKNRIKELEEEKTKLHETNTELSLQVEELNNEVLELKTNSQTLEQANKELIKEKEDMVDVVYKCHLDLDQFKAQKHDLYIELQNTIKLKEAMANDLEALRGQRDLNEKTIEDLRQSNEELLMKQTEMIEDNLRLDHQNKELKEEYSQKIQDYVIQIRNLSEQMARHVEEISNLESSGKSLKMNYEKLVIENEELKKKSREADSYLQETQKSLQEKQKEIEKLGQDIEDFQKKNQELEQKINDLMQQNQEEKHHHLADQTNNQMELKVLQEDIDRLTLEKQKVTEILQKDLEDLSCTNKTLEEKISNLIKDNEKYENAMANYQQKIEALVDDLNKMQVTMNMEKTKWQEEISKTSQQNEKLTKEIEEMKQQAEKERLSVESLQTHHYEEIKSLGDNFNKLQIEKQMEANKFVEQIKEISESKNSLELQLSVALEEWQEKTKTLECEHQKGIKLLEDEVNRLQLILEETKDFLSIKSQESEERQQLLGDLFMKINGILQLFEVNISEDCLENIKNLEKEVKNLMQQNNDIKSQLSNQQMSQSESQKRLQQMQQDLNETNKDLSNKVEEVNRLRLENSEYENKIAKLQEKQNVFIEQVKADLSKKQEELNSQMQEAAKEYEASIERMRNELIQEKEHYAGKERELLLVIDQHNVVKKDLHEREMEIGKLMETMAALQEQNKQMKLYESRVNECSQENTQLQQEIDSFKQQVHKNALRLLEADKALNELLGLSKEQEENKKEILRLQEILREKENALHSQMEIQEDLEKQVQQQCEAIEQLSETLKKLEHHKESLDLQIQREQEEKSMLLNSLEKSADHLKSLEDDSNRQKATLEQKYLDLKQELDELTMQNTKIQGDLVEREAELRMSLEDHEQERESFEQTLNSLRQQMTESSEQLESFDMALMEILALMENNFNMQRDMQKRGEVKNHFNMPESNRDTKINQLRGNLNLILHMDMQIRSQLKDLNQKRDEAISALETVSKTNSSLQATITQQNKDLKELKEQVENEELIAEKRASQEILRLEEDLLNLEKVNERLSNGNLNLQEAMTAQEKDLKLANSKLQKLEEEKLCLKEEICTKSMLLEKLQQEETALKQAIKEKTQKYEKAMENYNILNAQLKEKSTKLQNLDKERADLREKLQQQEKRNEQLKLEIKSLKAEQGKLQEKLKQLQNTNDSLEADVANKTKELLGLNNKATELLQALKNIEQQLQVTTKKLDESEALKLNSESNLQQMHSESQQLQRDIDFLKAQQHSAQEENTRLGKEIESLKQDKQHLREEIRDTKSDLQRANDNVTQLIQQISSIRLEKEAVVEENSLLRKQLDESGKHHSSSENKLKSIVEKSQDLERKLLSAENELKSVRATLEKSEHIAQKLTAENTKLRDSQETSTKRIEKLALKLGDSQAKSTKLERDNEKLAKTLEANVATLEALQKEKDLLQSEAKALKERLSRAERAHENLATKVQNLEQINLELQETKQKLEASEIDGKTKLNKLEKIRIANEEKMRKLVNSLNNAESDNVKLNLEIGSLNSQLQEVKLQGNNRDQIQDLSHKLEMAQQESSRYKNLVDNLQQEIEQLRDEKINLSDKLSKDSIALHITKQQCEKLCAELEHIRSELLQIKEEKSQAETLNETTTLKLKDLETQNDHLQSERKNLIKTLEIRIATLEKDLSSKTNEVETLQTEIKTLRENSESNSANLRQAATITESELDQLRAKISKADEALQKEQQIIAQLRLDNQILHTKYQESKQRALDATKQSEERIKENRLELEGKLEKMKNKMDGPHSFDDSMSALLSTTAGGTRKKCNGVTHYKRPGPPTPSKNGRLSFGGVVGIAEPSREILKESFDSANSGTAVSSSSKTPARFNFFASRFSMGNGKDEKPAIKQNININTLKQSKQSHPPQLKAINRRLLVGVGCTSTPRKSKVHYDHRRLLDQLLTSSPSPSPLSLEQKPIKIEKKITPPDVSIIETPVTSLPYQEPPKAPCRKQTAKRLEAIAAGLKHKRRNSSIYGRRLSRRMQEICTPTSGETTTSAYSNTPKDKSRRQTISSSATTTSGGIVNKTVILQKRLTKKPQKERNARPSLNLKGGIFVKHRNTHRGLQHDQYRYKARKQRLDEFNKGRDFRLLSKNVVETPKQQKTVIANLTYDIANNNYKAAPYNPEEMTIITPADLDEEETEDSSFLCTSETFDTKEAINLYPYNVCDYDSDGEVDKDEIEEFGGNITKDIKIKKELVTSLQLEEFDRYISKAVKQESSEKYSYLSNGSSQHFEKLVMETESNAPFEIKRIEFNVSGSSCYTTSQNPTKDILTSSSSNSISQHHHHHHRTEAIVDFPQDQHVEYDVLGMSSPPPPPPSPSQPNQFSPSSNPGNLSRIIYGGTVIYNRRLPNINTTYVRKSSIYVKNKNSNLSSDSMSANDVILIANQTITVADLARMWKQMDSSARLIVSFAVLASFTTLLGLFLSFYAKH
ncbi:mushroom body defect isoform X2 [Haematobia irritans]|uniref:mushroom body defect isoform X2 n=1 Tax=Haematobia irritans TaxID=7368 RepID=UPI003F4F95A2